jgi:hypothetical protein
VPAKSKGVVLFAFNTNIDYVQIAIRAARLIQHTLKLPVTLITDRAVQSRYLDQVIVVPNLIENNLRGNLWRNCDRYRAYELSPYNTTLLIDADYLMLDQSLLKLFDQDFDYRIMSYNQNFEGDWAEPMGTVGLIYQWATAILFNKTPKSKMLFDLVARIQKNYSYYAKLYHTKNMGFRNDYAFTMANNILNGYTQELDQGIPWKMLSIQQVLKSITIDNNLITVKTKDKAYLLAQQNIHILDKNYLLTDDFNKFVDTVCKE